MAVFALARGTMLPFTLSKHSGPFDVTIVSLPHLTWCMLGAVLWHRRWSKTYRTQAAAWAYGAPECSIQGTRKPSPVRVAVVHQSWDLVHQEAVEPGTARVTKWTITTSQHVVDIVCDIGSHPAEPIHGGAWRAGMENHFHV